MRLEHDSGGVRVGADTMIALVSAIFERAGCSRDEAERIGRRLTGANLRGHDSHGVIRTPRYVEWLEQGRVVANADISVEKDAEVYAIIDGNYGFGQTVGELAVDIGIDKAKRHGVAVTALKNAGHLGRIGDWAERAAAAGIASIHMVNVRGSLLVAPFGGRERRGSTSPFCMGVPLPDGEPVVLDFATSMVAEGKALVALRGGKPLPEGALVDGEGRLTSDPRPLYGELTPGRYPDPNNGPGALTGFGGHKGSGLNFFMEMMAGALTGSGTSGGWEGSGRRRFCNGMLSVYLSLDAFHDDGADWFGREVRAYIEFFKSARPVDGGGEVMIPGEPERRLMTERGRRGLPLPAQTWADIIAAADKVGLSDAELREICGDDYRGART